MECEAGKKNVVLRRPCVRFVIVAMEITCREGLCLVGEVISHPGAGTTNVPAKDKYTEDELLHVMHRFCPFGDVMLGME